jgi:hypothetical protein
MFVFSLVMSSCSSSKTVVKNNKNTNSKADKIIAKALQYKGFVINLVEPPKKE